MMILHGLVITSGKLQRALITAYLHYNHLEVVAPVRSGGYMDACRFLYGTFAWANYADSSADIVFPERSWSRDTICRRVIALSLCNNHPSIERSQKGI